MGTNISASFQTSASLSYIGYQRAVATLKVEGCVYLVNDNNNNRGGKDFSIESDVLK